MKTENEAFHHYLYGQGETEKSITEHIRNLDYFKRWTKTQDIAEIENLNRNVLLEYAKYMQNIPIKTSTQNIRLNSLNKYYEYLKTERIITKNPVGKFRIRNIAKRVVRHPMNESDLQDLYHDYTQYLIIKPRRQNIAKQEITNLKMRLVTSLVIFQGLHTGELDKLTRKDINLDNSTLYIPSTGRSKSRVIPLTPQQIIPFYEYLNLLPENQNKLFQDKIQKSFHRILDVLKGINPNVQNLQHIRASVLMNWIKQHGKRKAQYMIGHAYVSTTQSYEIQDISELSELMEKTHLFG